MPMTVLKCGSPADGFQIVGLFADRGDAESYAEDYSLKDWWVARLISREAVRRKQVEAGCDRAWPQLTRGRFPHERQLTPRLHG
jgi:hypothetical protein